MTRAKWNAVVDTMALLGFAALVSTGLLMRYQLPPGSGGGHNHESPAAAAEQSGADASDRPGRGLGGRNAGGERQAGGKAANSPALVVWGLTRHEWGTWHFRIAVGLLGILALHVLLHARWILGMVRGKASDASGRRLAVGVIALLAALAAVSAPLLSSVVERAP